MARTPSEPRVAPLFLLFFFSGASALVYEVVWTRLLTLAFGVTSHAVATVVAAFMAGLALGSLWLARRVDRVANPLRLYALLEAGIGVAGLLMPPALAALTGAAAPLQRSLAGSPPAVAAFTFAASFALLLVPTTLMGATLPALARHLVRRRETIGRRVGLLYAVNTFGGVAGTFASAFLLIANYGVARTNLAALGLNAALAVVSLALARGRTVPAREAAASAPGREERPARPAGSADRPAPRALVVAGYALAGATALAYQVLLTRLAVFFLWDTTVYTFAAILTTFLAGIALGSAAAAAVVERWRAHLAVFGLLQWAVGLAGLLLPPAFGHLSVLRQALWESLYRAGELSVARYLGLKFLMAAGIVIVPTMLMGAMFPVVNRLLSRDPARLGRSVGLAYGANTVGAIGGSLLAGFWLVEAWGIARGIMAVALVNAALGTLLVWREAAWSRARRVRFVAAGVLLFAAGAAVSAPERPVVRYADPLTRPGMRRDVLYSHEGREATLAVLRDPMTGVKELNINGLSTAFTTYMDLQVHRMLGHLPALCHPDPQTALVIGFGFGGTCYAVLSHGVASLDCVELVETERETAVLFPEANQGVLRDPRLRFIEGDGRHHVLITDRRYDLLSFNAIHPKLSASLYTLEFYRLCRDRLTEDGVIAAWLPINFLSREEFRMLVGTFREVFPHAGLWYVGPGHAVLVGTLRPLALDWSRIAARMALPEVRADLARSNLEDPCELLTLFALDEERLATLAGKGPLNTDDRPRVEFGISFSSREWYLTLQDLFRLLPAGPPPLAGIEGASPEERDRLERFFAARPHAMHGGILQTVGLSMRDTAMIRRGIEGYRKAVAIAPESRNLRRLLADKEADYAALTSGGVTRP